MNIFKRTLSLCLALLMLCTVLLSCSKADEQQENGSESGNISTSEEEETKGLDIESFADANGTPRDFNMLVRAGRYRYLYATSDDSDVVARASYERNTMIEEQFGILLDVSEVPDAAANWSTVLSGATGEYDLACFDYLYRVEEMGLLYNILDMPEIDTADTWWYQGWNDVGTVNGKMYSIAGDAANEMVENMSVVFFNKLTAKNHDLDMYKIVNDGDWTLERMKTISAQVATGQDDGDDTNDTFGVMFDLHSVRMANACFGIEITRPTANGYYEVVDDSTTNSRNFGIIQEFTDFLRNSGTVQYSSDTCRSRETTTFTSGKSLFFATALLIGERMKNKVSGWEYGMLPYPKYQENDDYRGTIYGCSIFGIPKSVKDTHCSAVILNALNYYGKSSNINAFYDTVSMSRVATAPEDAEMLELTRARVSVDFAFVHDENVMTLFQRYAWCVSNGEDPASVFQQHKSTAESGLAKVLQAYQ